MGVVAVSNEFVDVAALNGAEMAADALHCLGPDEVIMRAEEGERAPDGRARCLLSLILCITWEVIDVRTIRDRLAVVTSFVAPDLLPKDVWHGREEHARLRRALANCPQVEWEETSGRLMIELLSAAGWSEREIGKRSLCLLYAFVKDKSARPVLAQSLGTIGRAIGSVASNPRAGVSDAMQRIVIELVHRMERLTKKRGSGEFWFMKRPECRERLSRAMMGKRNRAKKKGARA